MKLIYGLLILCVISVASCRKDKFSSAPSLKFKSVSTTDVPYDRSFELQFVLEYTDADGDLAGVPVAIQKLSSSYPCASAGLDPTFYDSSGKKFYIDTTLPSTKDQKGEIIITLLKSTDLADIACSPLDSIEDATFRFWLKDHAGNVSDTVTSPIIRIRKTP